MLGTVGVNAQISFKAQTNSTTLAVGERFQIHYALVLNEGGDVRPISLPNFTGFQMVGRRPARNISVINGDIQNEFLETIFLVAQREGDYTIPGAKVYVNGQQYTTNTITLTVQERKNKTTSQAQAGEEVFMDIQLSEEVVYPNQPLYAVVKLYAKSYDALRRRSDLDVPRLNNFQVYRLDDKTSQRQYKEEIIQGVRYLSEEVAKFQLFPQQSGVLEIQPFQMRVAIPLSFFDEKLVSLSTKSKWVDVKALPAKMPKDYQGAIGNFQISATPSANQVAVGESVEVKIVVQGNGNFSEISAPKIPAQSGLEFYPVKTINQYSQSAQSQSGSKTFKYLIVPQKPGDYTLQAVTLHYLDPANSTYASSSTAPITFTVQNSDIPQDTSQNITFSDTIPTDNTAATGIQKYIPRQIERVFDNTSITSTPSSIGSSQRTFNWMWLLLLLPAALLLYAILRRKSKNSRAQTTATPQRNSQTLEHKLQTLQTDVRQNDLSAFLRNSSDLLNEIIIYVNAEPHIYTVEQGRKILTHSISESYAAKWEQEINKSQLMRYSSTSTPVDLQTSYQHHQDLIKELLAKKLK